MSRLGAEGKKKEQRPGKDGDKKAYGQNLGWRKSYFRSFYLSSPF